MLSFASPIDVSLSSSSIFSTPSTPTPNSHMPAFGSSTHGLSSSRTSTLPLHHRARDPTSSVPASPSRISKFRSSPFVLGARRLPTSHQGAFTSPTPSSQHPLLSSRSSGPIIPSPESAAINFRQRCKEAMERARHRQRREARNRSRGLQNYTTRLGSDGFGDSEEEEDERGEGRSIFSNPRKGIMIGGSENGLDEDENEDEAVRQAMRAEYLSLLASQEAQGAQALGWLDAEVAQWLELELEGDGHGDGERGFDHPHPTRSSTSTDDHVLEDFEKGTGLRGGGGGGERDWQPPQEFVDEDEVLGRLWEEEVLERRRRGENLDQRLSDSDGRGQGIDVGMGMDEDEEEEEEEEEENDVEWLRGLDLESLERGQRVEDVNADGDEEMEL